MSDVNIQFEIVETINKDSDIAGYIGSLIREALGLDQPLEMTLSQIDFGNGGTVIVLGKVGGDLATMNAFIAHPFSSEETAITGYQSGFSATADAYRGKGLWPKMLVASEEILAKRNGRFIFGFPNPVSHPLFVNKLCYSTQNMMRTVLPTVAAAFLRDEPDLDRIMPDVRATYRWKRASSEKALISHEYHDAYLFGRMRLAKGVKLLDIGAVDFGTCDPKDVIKTACRAAGTYFFSIEVSQGSRMASTVPLMRRSRPIIFKSLKGQALPPKLEIFGGLADTY